MKTTLAVLVVAVVALVLVKLPFASKPPGDGASLSNTGIYTPPSKPELQEEMQIAGTAGSNVGQVADEILAGYQFAQQQAIVSHANCIIMEDASKKAGCHRFVNDQQQVPPYVNYRDRIDNVSANQCRNEIAAYYEAVDKEMHRQAMAESIISQLKTDWHAELDACNKYPYKALGTTELQPIIQGIEQTGDVKLEDLRAVLIDVAEKRTFADANARADYIKNIESLFSAPEDAGPVDPVDCERSKQKADTLSEALANIREFQQANLELWSSVLLQRKIVLWKKMLLTSEAAACETTNE